MIEIAVAATTVTTTTATAAATSLTLTLTPALIAGIPVLAILVITGLFIPRPRRRPRSL